MLPPLQQPRLAGWDRGRVGERLQAALAGLQELKVLRERQAQRVRGALAMETPTLTPETPRPSKERRLEATLAALKEQLSRLRRQDVGLKSHLDQLDQQISELKLDVSKTSIEYPDSDSRPSSGFYDLSDAGSCSLSNSCTSVFSESIFSSHASLLLNSSQHPKNQLSIVDYRPKSADETTVHNQFQQQGAYTSDGSQIKVCPDVSGSPKSRPRPVSTGDLERLTIGDVGFPKAADPKFSPLLCPGEDNQIYCVDPKYQSDLVSKSGNDVYPYPSPLHAVALQSPLFSLTGPSSETEHHPLPNKVVPNVVGPSLIRTRPVRESRPGGYINKLLQLTRYRGNNQADASERCPTKSQPLTMLQRLIIIPSAGGVKINSSGSQLEKQESSPHSNKAKGKPQREMPEGECAKQQGTLDCVNVEQTATVVHAESSLAVNGSYSAKSSVRDSPMTEAGESNLECSSSSSQLGTEDSSLSPTNAHVAPVKKSHKKYANAIKAGGHDFMPQGGFVHAKFVPAESHQVKVRFANSKLKPVKVKRRNSEKALRPGKQTFYAEKSRGLHHPAAKLPLEWNLSQRQLRERNLIRRPTFSGETTGRSCSESSLYPVPFRLPQGPSGPELYQASANTMYSLEAAYIDTATKKKHRKWQSTVEISAKTHVASLSSSFALGPPRPQGRRAGIMRAVTMRTRSKNRHPFRSGMYAKSESDQSEYSAECASLFHSTIAETSEGEVSDYTANRFGDSESSDSDSEGSSLTIDYEEETDEHELIWSDSSVRQLEATHTSSKPLPSMPKLCRIKASKALKKKIRRFQPASLKVMTMV